MRRDSLEIRRDFARDAGDSGELSPSSRRDFADSGTPPGLLRDSAEISPRRLAHERLEVDAAEREADAAAVVLCRPDEEATVADREASDLLIINYQLLITNWQAVADREAADLPSSEHLIAET